MNIGNPAEMTVLEFAQEIIRVTGSQSEVIFEPLPVDDPKVRQPDISLAREVLNWEPQVLLADGLKETVEYFSNGPTPVE
jgi:dTDP-glucose 4,6-dehydratase